MKSITRKKQKESKRDPKCLYCGTQASHYCEIDNAGIPRYFPDIMVGDYIVDIDFGEIYYWSGNEWGVNSIAKHNYDKILTVTNQINHIVIGSKDKHRSQFIRLSKDNVSFLIIELLKTLESTPQDLINELSTIMNE